MEHISRMRKLQKHWDKVSDALGLISVTIIIGFSLVIPQAF